MTLPVLASKPLPARLREFRWQTQEGLKVRPCVMTTQHLHNTLVMIWHHRMPPDARLRRTFRRYSIGYSDRYLMDSIHVMLHELSARSDRKPWMDREIEKMLGYLRENHGLIGQVLFLEGPHDRD